MNYTELTFSVDPPDPGIEILIALLAELGFDSFEEMPSGLNAYIQTQLYTPEIQRSITAIKHDSFNFSFTARNLENKNWNAVWESNYEPVLIENAVYIYAPFHPGKKNIRFPLLIEPKMSFGTAHHETTSLMIAMMLNEKLKGHRVLDMGCGTAVLAILAEKMSAIEIQAIDNDQNAYDNSLENIARNNCKQISVDFGGVEKIQGMFNRILANINKNILLNDMAAYARHLLPQGAIFFSGFYQNDLADIEQKAKGSALTLDSYKEKNNWVCARFIKNK